MAMQNILDHFVEGNHYPYRRSCTRHSWTHSHEQASHPSIPVCKYFLLCLSFNTNTELLTNEKWNLSNMHIHTSKPLLVSVVSSLSMPYQGPSELMKGETLSMVSQVNRQVSGGKQTNLYLSSCSCNVKRTSRSSSDTSSYKTSRKGCTENTKKICVIARNSKKPLFYLYQRGWSKQFT